MMFNNPAQSLSYIKAGKLRALATTGSVRMAQAPELPTIAELGYAGYDVGTWFGIWGPAGLQPAVAEKINTAIVTVSKMPEIRELLLAQGMNVIGSSTAELATFQKSESERWGKVIKTANIKLD